MQSGALPLAGKRVLELGAGTGAVGIAAMSLGAASVCMTDQPSLLFLLRENAQRNAESLGYCADSVHVESLWWGPATPAGGPWDVILGCDVAVPIFDNVALAEQFAALLDGTNVAYTAYEERKKSCWQKFNAACVERQIEVRLLAYVAVLMCLWCYLFVVRCS